MSRCALALVVLFSGFAATAIAEEGLVTDEQLRAAVAKALPLIESSAVEFTKQRDCFSCHHQALGVRVMKQAAARGFSVDDSIIAAQVDWTAAFLKRNQERYLEGHGQGGQVDTAGYALWTLATGEYAADDVTAAVCHYLLVRHQDLDHWVRTSTRPPSEASDFTTTFVALQSLKQFATPQQSEQLQERVRRARQWLEATSATDTEDHVFRLRGLHVVEAQSDIVSEAAAQLLAQQHEDGSWSQNEDLSGDAYATGSALVTLAECGGLATDDLRYQRGLQWLVSQQGADGSWHVPTRSEPIQVYFESGFPHGKDQFISMSGTCWSVLAALEALPEK